MKSFKVTFQNSPLNSIGASWVQSIIHDIDAFHHHLVGAVAVDPEDFGIANQPTEPDTHQCPPTTELIEHGDLHAEFDWVMVREIKDRGAELDVLGLMNHGRQKQIGISDRLGDGGLIFTDPGLTKTELVGENHRFPILLQDFPIYALLGM
jgi:hypothetical protein